MDQRAVQGRPSATSPGGSKARTSCFLTWKAAAVFGNASSGWREEVIMMSFFDKLFGRKNSADSAKERLQLVLVHDRTDLTPAELESLRDDLVATVSRHVDIDVTAMQFGVEHDGRSAKTGCRYPHQEVPHRRKRRARRKPKAK
ncbi:MAG: cell division topological specificity factor MinE [Ignavibacteriales bacterium]|nr:cell division topological specificity factor MinE [Ignavibacteriales bacterium]